MLVCDENMDAAMRKFSFQEVRLYYICMDHLEKETYEDEGQ